MFMQKMYKINQATGSWSANAHNYASGPLTGTLPFPSDDTGVNTEQWWNDTDGKTK